MAELTTIALEAPAAVVTLFEDRASVLRRGRIDLSAGLHRLRLDGVAPVLSDRSLRVALLDGSVPGAGLVDFRVKRELIVSDSHLPEEKAALAAEERQRSRALERNQQRVRARKAQRDSLRDAAAQLIEELAEDAGWGRADTDRWVAEIELLRQQEATLDAEILELGRGLEDAERELAWLRRRSIVVRQDRVDTWLELEVELVQAGSLELELAYVVPCACWRPRYRATLSGGPSPQLELEHQANLWQRTGEDWCDVQLRFSTQRPSLGTEPPQLAEDLVHVQARQEQVVVELREQQIHSTGLGQQRAPAQELPGVDDGGEPVSLQAEHPATVPSDGRPYRVEIGRSRAPATVERVVMGELASAVLVRCTSSNSSTDPLLAGPVDLIADSGRVGRSQLSFVAPGEKLELGFGPDASLRVFRRSERVEEEPGVLSRWHVTRHHTTLLLSNLGSEARRVRVLERIPVSEIDQVRITLDRDRTTGGIEPDADGMLQWERELAPGATDQVELAYAFEKRGGVVER
jgi:uncharacterized protein (TIGR02231 family)